jgi:putative ABC transport system permease protein
MYTASVAGESLAQEMKRSYAVDRNLHVRGADLAPENQHEIQNALGTLHDRTVEFREAVLGADREIVTQSGEVQRVDEVLFVRLWSFPLEDDTELQVGAWPSAEPLSRDDPWTTIGVVAGADAAEALGLRLGDDIQLDRLPYRLRVQGIVTPLDPSSDLWWSDATLLPFGFERVATNDVDNLYVSLILRGETMRDLVPEHDRYWRVLLHWNRIDPTNALRTREQIVALQSALSASGARVRTGLVELLDQYRAELALGRISFLLLTAQSLLAVLYVLAAIGALLVDQSARGFATMAGRGFTALQIARALGIQAAALGALALAAGPPLALGAFQLYARLTGLLAVRRIPPDAWWLSAVAVFCGWAALVVPAYLAARRGLTGWQRLRTRAPRGPGRQRLVIDVFVLALGGLAYWQLRDAGTFVREAESVAGAAVDPVLLLGPSLLLLSLGLVFLRLFPVLLRAAAWFVSSVRGLVLPLAIKRLARSAGAAERTLLLVTMTTGLVLFASVFGDSIAQRQREVAHYVAGSDLRVALPRDTAQADAERARVASMRGVRAATHAYRGQARLGLFRRFNVNAKPVDLLAVEPARFAAVASYPPGIGRQSMASLMGALEGHEAAVVPVLASPEALPRDTGVGDRIQYYVGSGNCAFEIRAVIDDFPTLDRPFLVANLEALSTVVRIADPSLSTVDGYELWLDVDSRYHERVREAVSEALPQSDRAVLYETRRIVADTEALLRTLRSDMVARITTSAFRLNAVILVVLSSASLILTQVFAARRHSPEFGVLRALGLMSRELLALISLEGIGMLVLGLLAGTAVGYGLAYAMRPFLALALAPSLGGYRIDRLVIDWGILGRAYGGLALVYAAALLVLLIALVRSRIHRALRLGDE